MNLTGHVKPFNKFGSSTVLAFTGQNIKPYISSSLNSQKMVLQQYQNLMGVRLYLFTDIRIFGVLHILITEASGLQPPSQPTTT
jgi:hypothetical protein